MSQRADVIIIGGGIIGLATAYNLVNRFPERTVIVLEKEKEPGQHQSSHNSGVLHSGIYYKPGSLKAENCRTGKEALQQFCQREGIPFDICGKVIVAVDERELPSLERIYERGRQNGVKCELIDADRLAELEPHASGLRAIHVPEAGIVDFAQVCRRLAELIAAAGSRIETGHRVHEIRAATDEVVVGTTQEEFHAPYMINCGGLHCDRLARLSGLKPAAKIVPFRGEYYQLRPEFRHLCRNLIYPVPDPNFPFLGVHFTRMMDQSVECGPNAVLAFAREGYRKHNVNLRDLGEALFYRGFLRLACRYWRMGAGEMWRSLSKAAFVRALQRLMPEVQSQHLVRARAGVRAQAVTPDGQMVDDFLIQETDRMVHVLNAPSPAATASLNIGRRITDHLAVRWDAAAKTS